jgi:hypothetical protein
MGPKGLALERFPDIKKLKIKNKKKKIKNKPIKMERQPIIFRNHS